MNMQSMEIWQALRDYWTSLEVARWVESRFFLRRHHQLKSYGQASAGYPIALNTNGEIDTSFMPDALLRDGSRTLTADWDIGDNQRVLADGVRARDGAGLRLEDDAGNLGVFVEDGGDVGIGTATPTVKLDVAGDVRLGTAVAPAVLEYADTGDVTNNEDKLTVRGPAYGGVVCGSLLIGRGSSFQNGRVRISYAQAGVDTEAVRLESGRVGLNVASPQGALHAHDGTGGMMFVTKAGIGATAQTIIPNGTGDVVRGIAGNLVATDGVGVVANAFNILNPATLDVTVGSLTLRLEVTAAGALTVKRQSGTGTATLTLLATWL